MRQLARAWAAAGAAALALVGAGLTGATAAAVPDTMADARPDAVPDTIPLTVTNHSGRGPVYLYVLGEDLQTGEMGYADAAGTFHPWPDAGPVPEPAPDAAIAGPAHGEDLTIRLPKLSGRVYFSYGTPLTFQVVNDGRLVQPAVQNDSDPNRDVMFSWTEYTLNDAGLWINSTQVDFFSAPYQVGVRTADGSVLRTGMLVPDGFDAVVDQVSAAPGTWGGLVQRAPDGSPLRVLSPGHGVGTGALADDTMADYVDRVWEHYRTTDLVVQPFSDDPSVVFTGRVTGDTLSFTDTSGATVATFAEPSSESIFGCAGDLHAPNDLVVGPIARTLCAGFNRTTLLTNAHQPDPDDSGFYADAVTNEYAKAVHAAMADGQAYAFAFDDVGAHESLVHDGDPQAAYISLDPFTGAATPVAS